MRKKELELLQYIQKHPDARYIDVLNAFDPVNQAVSTDRNLKELVRCGYLRIPPGASPPDCTIRLTSSGYVALESFCPPPASTQEQQEDSAAQDHNQHSQTKKHLLHALKLLWFLIGAVATLITIAGGWHYIQSVFAFACSLFSAG